MSNFGIKIDLAKLNGVGVTELQGQYGLVRCVVIPVEANHIFVGQKGVYLDLCAFEMKNPQYEATHTIKQSLPKAVRDSMTEEQRKALPIVGDLKPLGNNNGAQAAYQGGYSQGYMPAQPPAYGGGYAPTGGKSGDPF